MAVGLSRSLPADAPDVFGTVMHAHWRGFGIGTAILWVLSLAVTIYDAKIPGSSLQHRWTPSGLLGAGALSLVTGLFLLLLAGTFNLMQVGSTGGVRVSSHTETEARLQGPGAYPLAPRSFYQYVYFGGYPRSDGELPRPPGGDGLLKGRFLFDGKPVKGIGLSLTLNGKYETASVTTDEHGEFVFQVPSGTWHINRLATHSWEAKPDGGPFMIVTGREPKLQGKEFGPGPWMREKGLGVEVDGERAAEPALVFIVRPKVKITWPGAGDQDLPASVEDDVIRWEPYPQATDYRLSITAVTREGRVTSYRKVTSRRLRDATQLALNTLKTMPGDGEEKEYQVAVQAFSKDGTFLSESEEHYEGHHFKLNGDLMLVMDRDRELLGDDLTPEALVRLRQNEKRLEAAVVLIKDGLLDEAERVLAKIEGQASVGRKKAVTGYLAARRSQCDRARKLLNGALTDAGTNCVPEYYWGACAR